MDLLCVRNWVYCHFIRAGSWHFDRGIGLCEQIITMPVCTSSGILLFPGEFHLRLSTQNATWVIQNLVSLFPWNIQVDVRYPLSPCLLCTKFSFWVCQKLDHGKRIGRVEKTAWLKHLHSCMFDVFVDPKNGVTGHQGWLSAVFCIINISA